MAYLTASIYDAKPRVSADRDFVHIRIDAHAVVGLSRSEAAMLATDILAALQVNRFESIEVALPKPLADAVGGAA